MNSNNKIITQIILYTQKHRLIILGVFVAITIMFISIVIPILRPPQLRVSFLDVGQGDAILVRAPNGAELLIDAGPDQAVIEQLGQEKGFFDRTIDMILATHSDKDHIGGFSYVLDRYKVDTVIESEISSPTVTDRVFGEKVVQENTNVLKARTNERITLDPKHGVVVDILFPDQDPTGWETNEASIVVKVSYGTTSFMLTGDSPSEVEQHLVKMYGKQMSANVLKLGHHGSKTSSSDEFLKTVNPTYAIVSAGLGNKYGHPNTDVIERVESTNAEILETSVLGTITCTSDKKDVFCKGSK